METMSCQISTGCVAIDAGGYLQRPDLVESARVQIWQIWLPSQRWNVGQPGAPSRRSEIDGDCEWSRCVMACGFGWTAMACRRVGPVGVAKVGGWLARASL
jgi:hypothetical protein